MNVYFVNKTRLSNGSYEIHQANCNYLPPPNRRMYLGTFSTCQQAIAEAKKYYGTISGCRICSVSCHVIK